MRLQKEGVFESFKASNKDAEEALRNGVTYKDMLTKFGSKIDYMLRWLEDHNY